jgi:hypothetical protein
MDLKEKQLRLETLYFVKSELENMYALGEPVDWLPYKAMLSTMIRELEEDIKDHMNMI